MTDLMAARSQMAVSLAFHIIFAVAGIAMPVMMVIAEIRWRSTGDATYLELAKRWAKGTAMLFAVGAVSDTVCLNLSFCFSSTEASPRISESKHYAHQFCHPATDSLYRYRLI